MGWFHLFELSNLRSQSNSHARIDVSSCPRRCHLQVYVNCQTHVLKNEVHYSLKPEVDYWSTKPNTTVQWRAKQYLLNAQVSPLGCSFCGRIERDPSNPDTRSSVVSEIDLLTVWQEEKNALLLATNQGMRTCEATKRSSSATIRRYMHAIISRKNKPTHQ
jgi:hypothetical protein